MHSIMLGFDAGSSVQSFRVLTKVLGDSSEVEKFLIIHMTKSFSYN